MNKKLLLLAAIGVLASCGKEEKTSDTVPYIYSTVPLTNDQIIEQTQKCASAGMSVTMYADNDGKGPTTYIQCSPKADVSSGDKKDDADGN